MCTLEVTPTKRLRTILVRTIPEGNRNNCFTLDEEPLLHFGITSPLRRLEFIGEVNFKNGIKAVGYKVSRVQTLFERFIGNRFIKESKKYDDQEFLFMLEDLPEPTNSPSRLRKRIQSNKPQFNVVNRLRAKRGFTPFFEPSLHRELREVLFQAAFDVCENEGKAWDRRNNWHSASYERNNKESSVDPSVFNKKYSDLGSSVDPSIFNRKHQGQSHMKSQVDGTPVSSHTKESACDENKQSATNSLKFQRKASQGQDFISLSQTNEEIPEVVLDTGASLPASGIDMGPIQCSDQEETSNRMDDTEYLIMRPKKSCCYEKAPLIRVTPPTPTITNTQPTSPLQQEQTDAGSLVGSCRTEMSLAVTNPSPPVQLAVPAITFTEATPVISTHADAEGVPVCEDIGPVVAVDLDAINVPVIDSHDVYILKHFGGGLEKLGSGVYGTVYMGLMHSIDLPVAIKNFEYSNDEVNQDITREAKIQYYLGEKGYAPRVYGQLMGHDLISEEAIVQEYLSGAQTVQTLLDKSALEEIEWLGVVYNMASDLKEIHSLGVFHNDIKTDNVMVYTNEELFPVKFIDFGVSTVNTGYTYELPKEYLAQFDNIAPEVRDNQPTSAKTDIYSLGYMLFKISKAVPSLLSLSDMCMSDDPKDRPTHDTIKSEIIAIIQKLVANARLESDSDSDL